MLAASTPVHVQAMDLTGSGSSTTANANSSAAIRTPPIPTLPASTRMIRNGRLAAPFGFNAASGMTPGIYRQAFTTKFGSGTIGLFAATNTQDYGARGRSEAAGISSTHCRSPILPDPAPGSRVGDLSWRSSFAGSYKSNPNDALLNGLYTTASFGVTSFKTSPAGLPGLTNFTTGNDATALTATAGVGPDYAPNQHRGQRRLYANAGIELQVTATWPAPRAARRDHHDRGAHARSLSDLPAAAT